MKSRAILIPVLVLLPAILASEGLEPRQHTCIPRIFRSSDPGDGSFMTGAGHPEGLVVRTCQACVFFAHSRAVRPVAVPPVTAPDGVPAILRPDREAAVRRGGTSRSPRGPPPLS